MTALEYRREHYRAFLRAIAPLMVLDPPRDSPEGRLLEGVAEVFERYEREVFSIKDTPA